MTRKPFPAMLGIAGTTLLAVALLILAVADIGNPATTTQQKAGQKAAAQWTGTWTASPQKAEKAERAGFVDVTLRVIVHTTIGGNGVRIHLANTFGAIPLQIGAATVGIQSAGAIILPETLRTLTFNGGRPGATIAPGAQLTSDGVSEDISPGTNLAVSIYLPKYTGPPTEHADAGRSHQTSYISTAGDHTGDSTAFQYPGQTSQWFFLDGVDTYAPGTSAVVTLGDSITDGTASTSDSNQRYPDWLFDRLQAAGGPYARLSVLNAGIGGNELLRTSACCGASPSALARLDTDVLDQPGVRDVIVLLGTNDILRAHHASAPAIIAGLRKLITEAHARGVRVFGGTITPSSRFTPEEDQVRVAVNQWITYGGAFDGVIDFATAVADPGDPARLNPVYDSGAHLHPNDAGYHAMADAVDLTDLLGRGSSAPESERSCLVQPSMQLVTPNAGIDSACPR